jgi:hypothetical protein
MGSHCRLGAKEESEPTLTFLTLRLDDWWRWMMANDSGGASGILGVLVGALIVVALVFFVFGERLGLRGGGPTVKIEAPQPVTK